MVRGRIVESLSKLLGKKVVLSSRYHSKIPVTQDTFKLEPDYSGGSKMNELITGPMPYAEAMPVLIKVLRWIDENGWTTTLNSLSGPRRDKLKPVVINPVSNDTGTTNTTGTTKTELSNDELSGPDKDDSNHSSTTSNNKTTLPLNTRLSKYATLQMVINSDTARSKGIDNTPTDADVENLKKVCSLIYDKIYEKFNGNVKINSGYRSKELNKAVGGVSNSAHLVGKALDIDGINGTKNSDIFNYIKNNISEFDQLIWEYGNKTQPNWVHISYDVSRNRKSIFSIPSGLL
jgi:uncharacterized protein YcbK (DUF882 family)